MLKLFAVDKDTGLRFEIIDLYWFEEEGVHDWRGEAFYSKYYFQFYVDGRLVYTTEGKCECQS